MAHETILPAVRALLISDGASPEYAASISRVIEADEAGWVPLTVAASVLGVSARTAWAWVREYGVGTRSRRGRRGSLVDFAALWGAHVRRAS